MSGEMIAIMAVGVALAGGDPDRDSRLDERINGLESRLDGSIKALESRFDGLERQFGELRERMAHLEGLLEGLREAITGRVKAS